MEQDVDNGYRAVCSTCLSSDRNLFSLNEMPSILQIFRLLMYDFPGDQYGDVLQEFEHFICWECVAHMRRVSRFKRQVHSAQEHLRVLALSRNQESMDHTYMSQSLSSLELTTKLDYDKIYFDYTAGQAQEEWQFLGITTAEAVKSEQYDVAQAVRDNLHLDIDDHLLEGKYFDYTAGQAQEEWQFLGITTAEAVKSEQYDVAQAVRDNLHLDIDDHLLEVPEIVLQNPESGVVSHMVVNTDALVSRAADVLPRDDSLSPHIEALVVKHRTRQPRAVKQEPVNTAMFMTEYMSEADMVLSREQAKLKVQYASSVYKCELCIIGFYTQQQVEEHFVSSHRAKEGLTPCKVCYIYVEESKLQPHIDGHYYKYTCKLCQHVEYGVKMMTMHVKGHYNRKDQSVIKFSDPPLTSIKKTMLGKRKKEVDAAHPKPGDLRKLLSKTTIEGYQCLECDMFFKNSRARKNHVARFHREGLQCDHCKKRFVNRTTLATHLKLHEGPLPRKECPICHKMVRVMQLKYHIQRHQNKERYECVECEKVFSHAATYQAHLKYSRAHAPDHVFKFPCPMCSKGYPTKEQMQDHFNYQHLGKTHHKCPICDKPIASRANVEKHVMRVHGEKKEKPRNHQCQLCGKSFTDKKALTQHAVIHSGDRPLSCDICQQTFKQKASLYTHRKRVHKVFPQKRYVEFVDTKPQTVTTPT